MNDYMNFLQLAEERFSVRSFKNETIAQDTLDKIIKAGYVAPTACNLQPQRILVINNEESIAKFKKCTKCHFDAPVAMLICQDEDSCWVRKYDGKKSGDIDASIVTTHMMLEAASLGIGTTWVMHFDPKAIREEFKLPDNYEPVALLVMGYPADDAEPYSGHSSFKPLEELISYNNF